MQAQQPKPMQQALPQTKVAQPWVKPTFEEVQLNEALADFSASGNSDFFDSYAS